MDIGKSGGGTNIVVKSGPGQGDSPGSVCRREIPITAYDSETSACAKKKKGVSRGQKSFMVLVSLVTERNGPSSAPRIRHSIFYTNEFDMRGDYLRNNARLSPMT
jgi:hypothetical protein